MQHVSGWEMKGGFLGFVFVVQDRWLAWPWLAWAAAVCSPNPG